MAYVADLHIHSRFSRACSQAINIPNLAKWAKLKGIDLLGTGDFLHPLWFTEIKTNLKELGNGLFEHDGVKFLLTNEISCIYSEGGKTRRIHLVVFLPSLEAAVRLSGELSKKGAKLASDGRPILGLSTKALCDIVFKAEPEAIIIPAHIWTPWFSLFGSNSGYDLLDECFGEFSNKIWGIETGESSDPSMNWRIGQLDNRSILSFSDSHSVPNIGREATIFKGGLSYKDLTSDIKNQNIVGTIEFFPEEGMYHYSGHRNCGVTYSPQDIAEKGVICPKCGKKLTVGVMERVEQLSVRSEGELKLTETGGIIRSTAFPERPGYRKLIQLRKIIAEAFGVGDFSQKVQNEYHKLVTILDKELIILTKTPLEQIQRYSGEKVAEGVARVREGKVVVVPGFDGTYGIIKIWDNGGEEASQQIGLF